MVFTYVRMLASVVLIGSALLCSNVVLGSQNANPEFVQLRMARPRTISETPVHQESDNHRQAKLYSPPASGNKQSASSYFDTLSSAYSSLVKPIEFLLPQSLLSKRQSEVDDGDDNDVAAERQTPSQLFTLGVTIGKVAIGVGVAAGILVVIHLVLTCITLLIGGALVVQSLLTLTGAGKMEEMLTGAS